MPDFIQTGPMQVTTEESFDTIALYTADLQQALVHQWDSNVNKSRVCLTTDQKCMCDAMGNPLPFFPFSSVEEKKTFAQCVLDADFPSCEKAAAVEWCKFVDGG